MGVANLCFESHATFVFAAHIFLIVKIVRGNCELETAESIC